MREPAAAPSGSSEVFIIDDDPGFGRLLSALVREAALTPVWFRRGVEALEALESRDPRAVCLDVMLAEETGEQILARLRERRPDLPVIMLSGQGSVERAVTIMKLKPFDYFVKPFDHERLVRSVESAIREYALKDQVRRLEHEVLEAFRFDEIVGASLPMRSLQDQIRKVLDSSITVFISGESGTGKELVAKAIHYNGPRRAGPFVTLNCGAIPESLQESELFGHEKGSFTGAISSYRGKFEQAHGGTLFLDEVGELSPGVQTRLLRVLQDSQVQHVGGTETIQVDVRFIAATHRDLEQMVRDGEFREDLYYRLAVYPIDIPALRERREDIPVLVAHLVRKHQRSLGTGAITFDRDALDVLCRYDWPGNVRELENTIQRTIVSARRGTVTVSALPPKLVMRSMGLDAPEPAQPVETSPGDAITPMDELERRAIEHALKVLEGNVSLAAERLGLGRATLYRKLAKYGFLKSSA
jgi:DNA-binding NtrC family response regulator